MILVKDLKKDIFPIPFLEYLPEICDYCGSYTEVIETLSFLQCSNKHCVSKIGYSVYLILKDMGIFTLKVDDCIDFLRKMNSYNPYIVFKYNPDIDGVFCNSVTLEESIDIYNELQKKRGMLLWEFIRLGHFDNLGDSVEKIFKNFLDINEFFLQMGKQGIPFIQELLLKETDYSEESSISVMAVLIYESLVSFKNDILEGIKYVIILNPEIKIGVLFANNCTSYKSNKDFLIEINKQLKNKIYLYELYTLTSHVSLIYWEEPKSHTYNSIIKRIKETDKFLVNADNIFNVLLKILSEGKNV